MKLPKVKIKFSFSLIINPILILVILSEIYFAYTLLYKNLNPQPTQVVVDKIVKVDLNAYQKITDLINSRQNFVSNVPSLNNPNPFKYGQ